MSPRDRFSNSEETQPPYKISEKTWWKTDSKTVLGIIALSSAATMLYLNMKSDVATATKLSTQTSEKVQVIEQQLNRMDGKLDMLLRK